ncbi:glycosyltransferase family 2 protein [Bacteroides nordii]|jgi:glycosyltransferase involved in cell wall biosynthesis|uniref:glycosyltransferase family 2 protein n=1 Tax=Bacteroides nordii TaxID=291645 RepID=UPI0018990E52|nr:glycosyltransferase family 2 protein [Bacteroides nordii]
MKISLITVTFNSGGTLRDTIQSVLSQTYPEIEYIIVDGLSEDSTIDIIKEYVPLFQGRLKWISEKDNGLYDAMNKGFKMATGEIVGIINSDDLLTESGVIGKVIDCFEGHKDIDCVYADLYYVSQYDTSKIVRHWITGKQRSFSKGWHPAHPTFYVKREIYSKYGLFDLDFKFAADFELMLRLVEKEHIRLFYLPEPLVRMRLGGTTSKNLTNIRKGNIECLNAFRKNGIPVSVLYPFYRLLPKLKQYFQ